MSAILDQIPAAVTAVTAAVRCDAMRRDRLADDMAAWSAQIRDGSTVVTAPPAIRRRPFLPGAVSAGYVTRMVLCMGLAEVARQHDPVARGYWILLTVALTMKPDFQPVLARTLQRAAGTVLGVLVAVPLLALPIGWWSPAVVGLVAGGIPYAVRRNYGLFSVLITPIVLILLALVTPAGPAIEGQRVIETLVGCAIVAIPGYLLWPWTWRPPSRATLLGVLDALAAWLATTGERDPARARLYRRLSGLETTAGHAPFEPGAIRRRRAAWSDVVPQIAEVAAAAAVPRQANDRPALADAAAAVRRIAMGVGRHPPGPPVAGEDDVGSAIAELQRRVARSW